MSVNDIGRRLKEARQRAQITQADVAKRLGVSYQTISSYERGVNRVDSDTLMKLCEIYGMTVGELMAEGDLPKKANFIELSVEEQELIDLYRRASEDDRLAVNLILRKYEDPTNGTCVSAG